MNVKLYLNALPQNDRIWPMFSLVFLCLLGGFNVFLPFFIVPRFEQIFIDALGPDYPLPEITYIIFEARIPLALIGVIWPLVGIMACWRRLRAAVWIILFGNIFFLAVVGFTVVALCMPM